MDEFNIDFDPTDEYESIESQSLPLNKTANEPQLKSKQVQSFESPQAYPNRQTQYYQKPQNNNNNTTTGHSTPYYYPVMPQNQKGQPVYPVVPYSMPVYVPYQPYPYVMPLQGVPAQKSYVPPASAVMNPYSQNVKTDTKKEKKKTPLKAKIFLISMLLLLIAFAVAIGLVIFEQYKGAKTNNDEHPLSEYASEPYLYEDNEQPDDSSPSYGSAKNGEEIDINITLQKDEGQTQKTPDSNSENTFPANKDAKKLKAKSEPKDKESSKYTAQSAYDTVTDSVVSIECYNGKITEYKEDIISAGTGTIITSDGYIVTNSHVISNSSALTINVILNNAKEYKAKVVGFDSRTDIAVLKIDAKNLSAVNFADSSKLKVGQDVIAIGNPGGTSFQNSLTKGIISAVERELDLSPNVKYIQIDAAINPGNSGGPLCNIYGQVIGINTAKISSVVYEGMGFAIPSNTILDIANDLIRYGYVQNRVRIGISGLEIDENTAYMYDLPYGVLIQDIDATGPLADTQAKKYDIITAINGKEVSTFNDIFRELEKYEDGDKIIVTVYRLKY